MLKRSTLIIAANRRDLLKEDYLKDADALLMDLEDAVIPRQKGDARKLVKDSLPLAGQCGAEVIVRINNDPMLLPLDLEAIVYPGLESIMLPKTESAEIVKRLDIQISELEMIRGIEPGHISLSIQIENPQGLLKAKEISLSSSRIESITLGPEDYCQALGVEQSLDGMELLFALSWIICVCKNAKIMSLGRLGRVKDSLDLEGFKSAVTRAMQLGCDGSFCAHPHQVKVLNHIFSPLPEKVEYAHRVVEAFEKETKIEIPGLMHKFVDMQDYNRARLILDKDKEIAKIERRKELALARLKQ
jgi:citrate lyase subunit beta/citryl-CoA lyase